VSQTARWRTLPARRGPSAGVPGTATRSTGAVLWAATSVLIALVVAYRWHGGWLLLLDWAPGPRSAVWPVASVPTGPVVNTFSAAVILAAPRLAGWFLIVSALVVTHWGAVRLARTWRAPNGEPLTLAAATAAGIIASANPFVAARVYTGQVGVLWGYALLWWLLASLSARVEHRGWRAWLAPALWLAAAAACTLHMAVIASVPVLAGYLPRARRVGRSSAAAATALTIAAAGLVTSVWFVPFLSTRGHQLGEPGGRRALDVFARDGSTVDVLAHTLLGAGFWRSLPPGTLTWFNALAVTAWILALAGYRWGGGWSRDLRQLLGWCVAAACTGVLVHHGPFARPWVWAVQEFAPVGLLREPGKWAMLVVPFASCAAAAALDRAIRRRPRPAKVFAPAMVLVLLAISGVGWVQLTNRVAPSTYPVEWYTARSVTDADTCAIAVLGVGAYTDPGFTGGRIVSQPAGGFFGRRAVASRDPRIPGLEPKPPRSSAEAWAASVNGPYLAGSGVGVLDSRAAAGSGVGWVFVDRPVDHPMIGPALEQAGFTPAFESARAAVWKVPGGCAGGGS
jgi:hypothetical protein